MTLGELHEASGKLLADGIPDNQTVGIEYYGSCLTLDSITVIVASDLWEAQAVVLTADLMEDGEADDG